MCVSLLVLQNCQSAFATKRTLSLNIESREINGSVIDKSKNKIIVPRAEKLGISPEIRIKAANEKDADAITIPGTFNENGELEIDISKLGPANSIPTGEYYIAATSGRKRLVTKFTYRAPKIIKGVVEVPVPDPNSEIARQLESSTNEVANAIISVNNVKTRKAIEGIKPIVIPGSQIVESTDNGTIRKNTYQVIAEIPGNILKDLSLFEVKAEVNAPTSKGIKRVTLKTLAKIDKRDSENNIVSNININAETTAALNIVDSAISGIKEKVGENAEILSPEATFNKVKELLAENDPSPTIDLALKSTKKSIKANSKELFNTLYAFIESSPSIASKEDVSDITVGIKLDTDPTTTDANEIASAENDDSYISLVDVINGLEDSGEMVADSATEMVDNFIEKISEIKKDATAYIQKEETIATL